MYFLPECISKMIAVYIIHVSQTVHDVHVQLLSIHYAITSAKLSYFKFLFLCVSNSIAPSLYRNITNLLEDIVFFVIKKESSSDRKDPLTEVGKPDRDRQKLLREQYVLKHVSNM